MAIQQVQVRELGDAMIREHPPTVQEREIGIGTRRLAWVHQQEPQPVSAQGVTALAELEGHQYQVGVIEPGLHVTLDELSKDPNGKDIMFVSEKLFNEEIQKAITAARSAGHALPEMTKPTAFYIESGMDKIGEFVGAVGELYRTNSASQPLVGFQIIAGQHGDEHKDGSRKIPSAPQYAHLHALQDFAKKDAGFMHIRCPDNPELEEWLNRALNTQRQNALGAACVLEHDLEPFESKWGMAKNSAMALAIGAGAATGVNAVQAVSANNSIVDGAGISTVYTTADGFDNWIAIKGAAEQEYGNQRAVLVARMVAESAQIPDTIVQSEDFRIALAKLITDEMGTKGSVSDKFDTTLKSTITTMLDGSKAPWDRDEAAIQTTRNRMAASEEFLLELAKLQVKQISGKELDDKAPLDEALVNTYFEKTATALAQMVASSAKSRNDIETSEEFSTEDKKLRAQVNKKYVGSAISGAVMGQFLNLPGGTLFESHNIAVHGIGASALALSTGLSAADAALGNTRDNVAGLHELARNDMLVLPESTRRLHEQLHTGPANERLEKAQEIRKETEAYCSQWGNRQTRISQEAGINNAAMVWSSVLTAAIPPSTTQEMIVGGAENYARHGLVEAKRWAENRKETDSQATASVKDRIGQRGRAHIEREVKNGVIFDIEAFADTGGRTMHNIARTIGHLTHAPADTRDAVVRVLDAAKFRAIIPGGGLEEHTKSGEVLAPQELIRRLREIADTETKPVIQQLATAPHDVTRFPERIEVAAKAAMIGSRIGGTPEAQEGRGLRVNQIPTLDSNRITVPPNLLKNDTGRGSGGGMGGRS